MTSLLNDGLVRISIVARETGLTSETLRKWEDRYGFPKPVRNASGIRLYPVGQIDRLRVIKRLVDSGVRPAVAIAEPGKRSLPDARNEVAESGRGQSEGRSPVVDAAISTLRRHDPVEFRRLLEENLAEIGLPRFVTETIPALNDAVGDTWAQGGLRVHEEHLYSSIVQSILEIAGEQVAKPDGSPRVLLTTAPGELHVLGIHMVKALFSDMGAHCILLGAQTPLVEIASAARAYRVDVVGLSFGPAFPARQVRPSVSILRKAVPPAIPIWIGGKGAGKTSRWPRGVRYFRHVADAIEPLRALAAGCGLERT